MKRHAPVVPGNHFESYNKILQWQPAGPQTDAPDADAGRPERVRWALECEAQALRQPPVIGVRAPQVSDCEPHHGGQVEGQALRIEVRQSPLVCQQVAVGELLPGSLGVTPLSGDLPDDRPQPRLVGDCDCRALAVRRHQRLWRPTQPSLRPLYPQWWSPTGIVGWKPQAPVIMTTPSWSKMAVVRRASAGQDPGATHRRSPPTPPLRYQSGHGS